MFLVNTRKCLQIFDRVYVSSDSPEILEQAMSVGAIPILRGEELCGDTPNIPVYQHALKCMGDASGIVAVQSNSPTINQNLITLSKKLLEFGLQEIMTCHSDYKIYGSIWGLSREKLEHYGDPYKPQPDILLTDLSIDIHTEEDLHQALCQTKS